MTKEANIQQKKTEDQILEELLQNLPSMDEVEVDVPSKGKFYKLDNANNKIIIRPLTFEDEKALISNKNVNIDVLNLLLEKCVKNISVSNLLQIDKLYLIMKIREISYGDEYGVTLTCPACKKDNNITFSLSNLNINYINDDFVDPIELTLPILKKVVKIRLPRVEDENYLQNSDLTITNLWRFVEEIEGHTKKTIISKVISKLPLKDAHAILDALNGQGYGIDTGVRFVCNYCSHNEITDLPIGADFFTGN